MKCPKCNNDMFVKKISDTKEYNIVEWECRECKHTHTEKKTY